MRHWKTILLAVIIIIIFTGTFLLLTRQPEIAPRAFAPNVVSSASIARGKALAALGDCEVCHTRPGGETNAGGLAMESPFGTIYTTNITPDDKDGIGRWSYEAFVRAMRHGIDRSGKYLYPAFPYTAFTRTSDRDLQDLYAFLMSQPPVSYRPPETQLRFPFNIRQGMALWNWVYLRPGEQQPDPQHDALWNRGAYLAEGLGHCSACHSPRNLAAAEKTDPENYLSGGIADGWYAPALNHDNPAPVAWDRQQLVSYFRRGDSAQHGVAAGPMAPVIAHGLSQQSDKDLQALAYWLSSFQRDSAARPENLTAQAEQRSLLLNSAGARQYSGSCMACHSGNKGPLLAGVRPALVLNSNLYSDTPDNLIHILLDGITQPAHADLGTMPGFRHQLSNRQIATLLNYLRQDLAGQQPWPDLEQRVGELRQQETEAP